MNLKKYSSYIFALLLCCGCDRNNYIAEEEKGVYTHNPYKLGKVELFKLILKSADEITKFSKKLKDRIPKWLVTDQETQPYAIWKDFFDNEIQKNIITTLTNQDHIERLEAYYDKFGSLFKDPTEANAKDLIRAAKVLKADSKLIGALNKVIEEKYARPENIYLTDSILAYNEFFFFILEKDMSVPRTELIRSQHNLAQWKIDKRPTGQALWERITKNHIKLIKDIKLYLYPDNKKAIQESLKLIDDKLTVSLKETSYKDLLETIPHGIRLIRKILDAAALAEKDDEDIQLLKVYLRLFPSILVPRH